MRELANMKETGIRAGLLATVSSIALVASVYAASAADRPLAWIEMGTSSDRTYISDYDFALPVGSMIPPGGVTGPLIAPFNLSRSIGENGRIMFQPADSNWIFSASVNFGRSRGVGHVNQKASTSTTRFVSIHGTYPDYPSSPPRNSIKTGNSVVRGFLADTTDSQTHTILDFSAGKDVGFGMFGNGGTSIISAGVRFANFSAKLRTNQFQDITNFSTATVMGSYLRYGIFRYNYTARGQVWHTIASIDQSAKRFVGVGPSLHWDASVPFAGDKDHKGELALDWGVNAAILFGRQKEKISHKSTNTYNCLADVCPQYAPQSSKTRRSRNITVPNFGGYLGLSLRFPDAKISLGYRGDFFFGAMDTGVVGHGKEDIGFHGPYASVSIGLQ